MSGDEWFEFEISGTNRRTGEAWRSQPKRFDGPDQLRSARQEADSLAERNDDVVVRTREVEAGPWVAHHRPARRQEQGR